MRAISCERNENGRLPAAHLGLGDDPSSARAHDRAGWRHFAYNHLFLERLWRSVKNAVVHHSKIDRQMTEMGLKGGGNAISTLYPLKP